MLSKYFIFNFIVINWWHETDFLIEKKASSGHIIST